MSHEHEHTTQHSHHHACANLFGCGDEKGIGILREDIKARAFDNRASDRLLHMDDVDQANLDNYLSARGRWRRNFLQASSFMGALAAVGPRFAKLARTDESGAASKAASPDSGGRVHVVRRPRKRYSSASTTPTVPQSSPSTRATRSAFPILGRTSSMNCSPACRSTP